MRIMFMTFHLEQLRSSNDLEKMVVVTMCRADDRETCGDRSHPNSFRYTYCCLPDGLVVHSDHQVTGEFRSLRETFRQTEHRIDNVVGCFRSHVLQ